MRIGILTFHHAANYGAVWQTICLSEAIRGLGHDVEVIDYRHPCAVRNYRIHTLKSRNAPFNLLKQWRLARDLRLGVRLSPWSCRYEAELRNIASLYNAVIVGSDEVWNTEGMRGWSPAYFLSFVPDSIRKVSYAASTGHRINTSPHGNEMRQYLARFDSISVRDQTSADVLDELLGRRPPVVVDPTLLAGARPPLRPGSHVALYGGLSKDAKQWLRKVACNRGMNVISIGFSNRVGGHIRIAAGLNEWLQTIGSARLVITTTFHGMIAAIVHQRPFWVLPRMDGATKVLDFLNAYNLNHRLLDPRNLPETLELETHATDYESLWRSLERDIVSSKNFLKNAIDANQG